MRKPENINLESMHDLLSILRTDISRLKYAHRQQMIDLLKKSDKVITVHLYSLGWGRRRESLIELNAWSYHQIYLCIFNGEIYYSFGYGRSSYMRENHNFFMEAFLKDKELAVRIPTAVIVSYKREALAYYFHEGYAYCNHDIGSNWDKSIRGRLEKSGLPYSQRDYKKGFEGVEVFFKAKRKVTIYKSLREDIWHRKLMRRLKRGAFRTS